MLRIYPSFFIFTQFSNFTPPAKSTTMGIFNKLLDFLTGGSADVSVDLTNASISKPFTINVSANIGSDDLNCRNVYIIIRCIEETLESYGPKNSKTMTDNEKILSQMNDWVSDTLYYKQFNITDSCILKKGQKYSWEKEIELVEATKVSLDTKDHKILWQAQAGIDVHGNDPDSGWVDFIVNP